MFLVVLTALVLVLVPLMPLVVVVVYVRRRVFEDSYPRVPTNARTASTVSGVSSALHPNHGTDADDYLHTNQIDAGDAAADAQHLTHGRLPIRSIRYIGTNSDGNVLVSFVDVACA